MGANPWGMSLHIPALIILQVIFIILFGLFTRYSPNAAYRNQYDTDHGVGSINHAHALISNFYPVFQDVHVMIFIGFGFLMTFLKRYGLSAVSLNMLCSALAIEWSILVNGFLHIHYDVCEPTHAHKRSAEVATEYDANMHYNTNCNPNWPWINIDLVSMLSADFATAAVLISFGVLLGTTSPIQLIVMTIIEIVLFNVNEVIGRSYIGAVDCGDTIFVHMFGAYFGLAISRVLYNENALKSDKAGANRTSDLFSMVGTVFLWMFWPSFNAGAAAEGDAQMRGLINTYLSLCACCMSAFAASALVNPQRKFCMEHIQNATLAGGVAVGATADMIVTPFGSIVIGTIAGVLSTFGYQYVSPWLASKWKIADTCGVHNLHGMPSILGGILSVLLAALASEDTYDQFNKMDGDKSLSSLQEIFPGAKEEDWTPGKQAGRQAFAMLVTLVFALIGGFVTGWILKLIAKFQSMYKKGTTVARLALNIGNIMQGSGAGQGLPKEMLFEDEMFFATEDEPEKEIIVYSNGVSNMAYKV